jgi:hypothetical protein
MFCTAWSVPFPISSAKKPGRLACADIEKQDDNARKSEKKEAQISKKMTRFN